MQGGGGGLLSFLLEKGSPGSESSPPFVVAPWSCAPTAPPPPATPHSLLISSPALSLHSEDFYGIALTTAVLGPVFSADEADYQDTEVMLGLKSANVYLFWLLSWWDWQARSQLCFLLPVGPWLYLPRRQSDSGRGSPLARSRSPAATPPAQSETRGSQAAAGSSVSLPTSAQPPASPPS